MCEVKHCYERNATNDVADKRGEHEADEVGVPGNGSKVDQIEDIDRTRDDVCKTIKREQVGEEDVIRVVSSKSSTDGYSRLSHW